MNWGERAARPASWWVEEAPHGDVVLSSRVRVARNLQGWRFPHRLSEDELRGAREEILQATRECPGLASAQWWPLEELEEVQRRLLLERHLVSRDLIDRAMGRGLLVVKGEASGVMVHEEDHLRIQAFGAGLKIQETFDIARALVDELNDTLRFARSARLGWLTACPSNLGTGLRASALVHLPGLLLTGDLQKVLSSLSALQIAVRGFWGEGSPALGALFQVSNSISLGLSERQILDDLLHHLRKLVSVEREARLVLQRERPREVEDRVWRAWGLLRSARLLSTREAFELLGDVRLGTNMKLLPGVDESVLRSLLVTVQAAHLELREGRPLPERERDELRAAQVREVLVDLGKGPQTGPRKDEE